MVWHGARSKFLHIAGVKMFYDLLKPDTRKEITDLTGKYGSVLADQVLQIILAAAGVGKISYAVKKLKEHLEEHLDDVPHSSRGKTQTRDLELNGVIIRKGGVNPTQMFLHRLKEEITPTSSLAA